MIRQCIWTAAEGTDPYENLAREKALTFAVKPGECILYLWQNRRTVVIGRNQNAWRECAVERLEAEGGHLARRLSGGGAVFHDLGNLNYSFCLRREDYDVNRQLEVILRAVRAAGIPAEKTGRNDLTADGRKFSGSAFFRSGEFCCHHGTLLLSADTEAMSRYLTVDPGKLQAKGVASVRARVGNLREFAPELTVERMREALREALQEVYGLPARELETGRISPEQLEEDRTFFASAAWKYGSRTAFSHVLEQRFPWGDLRAELLVQEGRIAACRIFSDAMETGWAERLGEAWLGRAYTAAALAEGLKDMPMPGNGDAAEESGEQVLRKDIEQLVLRELQ